VGWVWEGKKPVGAQVGNDWWSHLQNEEIIENYKRRRVYMRRGSDGVEGRLPSPEEKNSNI
jgi:hypothetical protein